MENISFNSTVFLEFLDCMQSVRVLSNHELERLVTAIFLSFSVCSCSVFRAIRGLHSIFFFQIKIRGKWQEEEQLFIKVALWRKKITDEYSETDPQQNSHVQFNTWYLVSFSFEEKQVTLAKWLLEFLGIFSKEFPGIPRNS